MRRTLEQLRKAAGLTHEDMAKRLGITRQYYGMIERGARTPTLDLALRIAELLGVSVEELFSETDSNKTLRVSG